MSLWMRIWFHFLRFMDDTFPGWQQPAAPPCDHLSSDSFRYWMTRHHRGGA